MVHSIPVFNPEHTHKKFSGWKGNWNLLLIYAGNKLLSDYLWCRLCNTNKRKSIWANWWGMHLLHKVSSMCFWSQHHVNTIVNHNETKRFSLSLSLSPYKASGVPKTLPGWLLNKSVTIMTSIEKFSNKCKIHTSHLHQIHVMYPESNT